MKVPDELPLPRIYFKNLAFFAIWMVVADDNVVNFFPHLLTFRDFLQIFKHVVANFLCSLIAHLWLIEAYGRIEKKQISRPNHAIFGPQKSCLPTMILCIFWAYTKSLPNKLGLFQRQYISRRRWHGVFQSPFGEASTRSSDLKKIFFERPFYGQKQCIFNVYF